MPAFAAPADGVGKLVTAMVTPFTADGGLDLDGAQRLAAHLVDHGSDTVLVHGTTGESPTLRHDEMFELLAAVLDAVGDRASVMMGTGSNDTHHACRSTERATEMGADSLLVVVPYYNRPDQRGLLQHFRAVTAATDRPVVLYDVPSRTGRQFAVDTLAELAGIEHVVGVKDATGDLGHAADTLRATAGAPGGFRLWSGADEVNLPLLAVGATGLVSVSAHLLGPQLAEMIRRVPEDLPTAAAIHLACMPVHRLLFAEASPAPVKAALAAAGLPAGPVRLPLADASPELTATLSEAVATTIATVDAALAAADTPTTGDHA
ncbi:4-hydroxy-tetrahydrodipicolinate synthase [Nitriliruptoraceae bacterium ZYF776]|nr:4-hydroxy-tetrahydrodipicolinate synthase [Profundirhabdus halotolerans]